MENAKEQTEAEIALEEAKRLRDEAEAMRAKAEEELKKAKGGRDDGEV